MRTKCEESPKVKHLIVNEVSRALARDNRRLLSELDKKLDQEIMKELDFLSFNVEKEQDLQIFVSEAN